MWGIVVGGVAGSWREEFGGGGGGRVVQTWKWGRWKKGRGIGDERLSQVKTCIVLASTWGDAEVIYDKIFIYIW